MNGKLGESWLRTLRFLILFFAKEQTVERAAGSECVLLLAAYESQAREATERSSTFFAWDPRTDWKDPELLFRFMPAIMNHIRVLK